ncbi:MAG TPA: 16S rRNA (guanine(527)-N(7))-methyltransferase RsmG [Longilinea sp.]|nr:16S rRNA (guanine(527)-N(7))-methyltransferase RsmG [Longilinea sp.]
MNDIPVSFAQSLQSLSGIQLNSRQLHAFQVYETELMDWNEKFNLTAIRDVDGIRTKHFLDSLTCLQGMNTSNPNPRLIDIGTGAGFPGLALKIAIPGAQLTLVESIGKKVEFCRHMVDILKLDKVEVIQTRAEEIGQMPAHREKYDYALARAVANLPILLEYTLPLVKIGGRVIAQKGSSAHAEANSSHKAMQLLGGHLRQLVAVVLPGVAEDRFLVLVDKVAATPPQYPRRVGVPQKKPL